MKLMLSFVAALFVVLLAGCAASGPKHAEIQAAIPPLKADQGRIYFYRPGSMMGAAIQPQVMLNGAAVGDSKPGGFFFVDRNPGPMEVSTASEVEKKLTFTLDRGQTRYVRTVISMGVAVGRVSPELVDNADGAKEIQETNYIGQPLK